MSSDIYIVILYNIHLYTKFYCLKMYGNTRSTFTFLLSTINCFRFYKITKSIFLITLNI